MLNIDIVSFEKVVEERFLDSISCDNDVSRVRSAIVLLVCEGTVKDGVDSV